MKLMVVSLTKHRIVQSDEARFDDRGSAMMTSMRKFLVDSQCLPRLYRVTRNTHIVIVEMTVRLAVVFVAANVLQVFPAFSARKALRMPPLVHRADDPSNNGIRAACTEDGC